MKLDRACLSCKFLGHILTNGLPQCGHEHPYLFGRVWPEWLGCNQWEENEKAK